MSTQQQQLEQKTINEPSLHALIGGILHDLGGAFNPASRIRRFAQIFSRRK